MASVFLTNIHTDLLWAGFLTTPARVTRIVTGTGAEEYPTEIGEREEQ